MKNERHDTIVDIIRNNIVSTQDDLAQRLTDAGFKVTQATVSRDIRELGLQKVPVGDGYRYGLPGDVDLQADERLQTVFRESVVSVDCAANIVVVKTLSGLAGAAFAAIDAMKLDAIVGSLAGDDTGFIVTVDAASAEVLRDSLRALMK